MDEKTACVALLLLPDMDNRALKRIKMHFTTGVEAWNNLRELPLGLVGGGDPVLRKRGWVEAQRKMDPQEALREIAHKGIEIYLRGDEGYPALLRDIFDPPELLFVHGERGDLHGKSIAVVGSRKASSYGRSLAQSLGRELSRMGISVISGAAYGIDTAAHLGSLEAGGPTFAVLGSGLDHLYPPENRDLFEKIRKRGALISEYPPPVPPQAWHFPERNRIIAGLTAGVVVVEAGEKSGALITADFAMEEGREVFAFPGSLSNPLSVGPHRLIQQGAKLVTCVDDILEELSWDECVWNRGSATATEDVQLTPCERELLELFPSEPCSGDYLLNKWDKDMGEFHLSMLGLLMKGKICEEGGGRYVKL